MSRKNDKSNDVIYQGRLSPRWLRMPKPKNDELFLHLWVGSKLLSGWKDGEFQYYLDFCVLGENPYCVEIGVSQDGKFIPS